jgi:energy-converting hydrogenase Eha subunit E
VSPTGDSTIRISALGPKFKQYIIYNSLVCLLTNISASTVLNLVIVLHIKITDYIYSITFPSRVSHFHGVLFENGIHVVIMKFAVYFCMQSYMNPIVSIMFLNYAHEFSVLTVICI